MGDLFLALSAIAAAFALYHKVMAGRALQKLLKSLDKSQREAIASAGEDTGAPPITPPEG